MVVLAVSALLVLTDTRSSFAQKSGPKTFSSPGEASNALFQAVKNEDEQALEAILGAGKEITTSNDEIEDKLERERFGQKYQEMHRLVREPDGRTVLYIGAENWPFPVPLVSKNGAWYFDSDSGKQEIMFRRVGENEASAIEVCHAFETAEKQGETKAASDDAIVQYSESLVTASATNDKNKESGPFHGYYFRIVTANSAAGTHRSLSSGKKTGGVELVAYPVEYRSSGIMTFIVTQDGGVYEKDLGPRTTTVAPDITQRRPNSSWHAAE